MQAASVWLSLCQVLFFFFAYHRLFDLVVDGHNASTRGTAGEREKKQAVSLQFKRLQSHLSPKLWTHATLQGLHQDSETESFATTERKTVLSAVICFFFFSFFPFSTSKIQLIALRESLLCSPVVSWGQSVRGSGGSDMLLKVQINGSREKKKHSWVHTVQGGFGHYYD